MAYEDLNFKIPKELPDYHDCSDFVLDSIKAIISDAIKEGRNKIMINTNLRFGLPMENINKVAGPFVEAWAYEVFYEILQNKDNKYRLINVEALKRLNMADILLQFKRERKTFSSVTGHVDVKATSEDIANSGKSPNITSFARIRTAYVEDPDFIFVILSLKHKVYTEQDEKTKGMRGIMEVSGYNAYDLKYLSDADISFNPALGSGQLQIRDIHYVTLKVRDVWEFCKILDRKCMASKKVGYEGWLAYAHQFGWIK